MTRDDYLLNRIRTVIGDDSDGLDSPLLSDRNLLQTYACWHVYGGGDWRKFGPMLRPLVRDILYEKCGHT